MILYSYSYYRNSNQFKYGLHQLSFRYKWHSNVPDRSLLLMAKFKSSSHFSFARKNLQRKVCLNVNNITKHRTIILFDLNWQLLLEAMPSKELFYFSTHFFINVRYALFTHILLIGTHRYNLQHSVLLSSSSRIFAIIPYRTHSIGGNYWPFYSLWNVVQQMGIYIFAFDEMYVHHCTQHTQ